jgi:putative membrane protein
MLVPRGWWQEGEDPDPRFSLANDRTFLAYVRTSLGLLAGALATAALASAVPRGIRLTLALLLVAVALALLVAGYLQWRLREYRMRLGAPLGRPWVPTLVTVALALVCGLVAAVAVLAPR